MKLRLDVIRRSGWGFGVEALHAGVGIGVFLLVGARLGPNGYGLFAAILSAVNLSQPFVSGAPSQLALSRASGHRREAVASSAAWRASAGLVHVGGGIGVVGLVAAYELLGIEIAPIVVAQIAAAEFVFLRLVPLGERIGEATGSPSLSFMVAAGSVSIRLASAIVFAALGESSLAAWASIHLVAAISGAVFVHVAMAWYLEHGAGIARPRLADWRDGLPFALSLGPNSILNDSDKVLLGVLAGPNDVGVYAAGYRLVALALLPIRGVIRSSFPSFFVAARQGDSQVRDQAVHVTRNTAIVGAAAGCAVLVGAPLVVVLLGEDFAESTRIVQWLAPIPLLKGVQYPAANALTALGRHADRVRALLLASAFNVALNVVLIPAFGWRAAVASTLIAELGFTILLWRKLPKRSEAHGTDI